MMMKNPAVDQQRITEILTGAFDTNKSVSFIVGSESGKARRIKNLMWYGLALCSRYGKVFLSSDKNACALVQLPHKRSFSLYAWLLDLQLVFKVIGLSRLLKVLRREELINRRHPSSPFYYLWFIGVDRAEQGQGKGTALMRKLLTEAKEECIPVYLETSVLQNVAWYQSFGFEVYDELDLGYRLYFLRKL
jgi:GNAT superfamily N-acetyltransferase